MRVGTRSANTPLLATLFAILIQTGASCGSAGTRTALTPSAPTPPQAAVGRVQSGLWGGQHIALEVSDAGAFAEFDCAHGTIDEPLLLDRDARFVGRGRYVRHRGGPQFDADADGRPARYEGRVADDSMTLTVALGDGGQQIGVFTLTYGRRGVIRRCE